MTRRSPNVTTRAGITCQPSGEYIASRQRTQGTETSKYLKEKKANSDSPSSGERKGNSLNRLSASMLALLSWSCGISRRIRHDPRRVTKVRSSRTAWKGRRYRVTAPYAKDRALVRDTRVPQDTCNPAGIWEDHLPRLNTPHRPIVN